MSLVKTSIAVLALGIVPSAFAADRGGTERDLAAVSQGSRSSRVVERDLDDGDGPRPVAIERPNAISLELLGRALLYSINYDHALNNVVSIGGGFSYVGISIGDTSLTAIMLPLYTNVYFGGDSHRGFGTVGGSILVGSATSTPQTYHYDANNNLTSVTTSGGAETTGGVGVLGNVGMGYEFRGREGFLFRAAPYLAFGKGIFTPWLGLSAGATF